MEKGESAVEDPPFNNSVVKGEWWYSDEKKKFEAFL